MPKRPTKTIESREQEALDIIQSHGGVITKADFLKEKTIRYVKVIKREPVVKEKVTVEWVKEEYQMTPKEARYILELLRAKGKIKYPVGRNKIKIV